MYKSIKIISCVQPAPKMCRRLPSVLVAARSVDFATVAACSGDSVVLISDQTEVAVGTTRLIPQLRLLCVFYGCQKAAKNFRLGKSFGARLFVIKKQTSNISLDNEVIRQAHIDGIFRWITNDGGLGRDYNWSGESECRMRGINILRTSTRTDISQQIYSADCFSGCTRSERVVHYNLSSYKYAG